MISFNEIPFINPVPKAFTNASFTEKDLANLSTIFTLILFFFISSLEKILSTNSSPYLSRIFLILETFNKSIETR